MEVIELKVRLHCKACENTLRKVLCKIKGVTCVEIDVKLNKITVLGYVDRKVIVKAVRKTGRRAELLSSSSLPPPPSPSCRRDRKARISFGCIVIPKIVF